MTRLELVPVTLRDARDFVARLHRHHRPPQGGRVAIAAALGEVIVGVAILGRPVARGFDDGFTVEVTRHCTDGTKNASSFLYGAAARLARALGYRRCITYTLKSESGTSLRASGWRALYDVRGRSWSCTSRPRVDTHPLEDKVLWQSGAA